MKTVDKAMSLLGQFSLDKTELGLSEISRMAALDKAATRRLLVALSKHGFIEQVDETRKYRLGHGFLSLARIREATVPLSKTAQHVADWLSQQVDETVHISVPGGSGLTTIAYRLPARGNVINIIPAQVLPYHATASGLVYLAFTSQEERAGYLKLPRERYTAQTLIDNAAIQKKLLEIRADGYAISQDGLEPRVTGIAMPFYLDTDGPSGTIAVALPESRVDDKTEGDIVPHLKSAIDRLTLSLSGNCSRSPS